MSGNHGRGVGLAACALLGMLLVGCEGGSNLPEASRTASLPTGSVLPTESRTASRSIDVPTPTRTRDDDATASASTGVSDEPAPATTAESPIADAGSTSSEESTDSWWVWLLLAAVVVGGIVWFLVARSRRRKWDAAYATELLEARWAADTFTPSVTDRSASPMEVTERWRRGKPRLDALLAQLDKLTDTATGAQRSTQAAQVSEAAAALGEALSDVVTRQAGPDATGTPTGDLDESRGVARARADALLDAIAAPGSRNLEIWWSGA